VLRDGRPRDVRIALVGDSTLTLRRATIRRDSIVGTDDLGTQRGAALSEVRQLETWQSASERVAGPAVLIAVGGVAALFYLLLVNVPGT
jgi:hypothetical protein